MTKLKNVPDTAEGMAELLADDARRSEVFASADTAAEFLTAYNKAVNKGDAISRQVSESVAATMTEFMRDNGLTGAAPNQVELEAFVKQAPGTSAQGNAAYNPNAPGAAADKLGFNSLGEFARAIWHKQPPRTEAMQAKLAGLKEITNAYSSIDPATGGFLIPETMRSEILSLALEQSIVRSRATVITMQSLTQSVPFVDVTTHVGSLFGGMVWYWTPESGTIQTSEAKFGRVKLEANKLTGAAAVPNELFQDAPALTSWLTAAIPQGLAFYEDDAFLNGNGVDKPLGVLQGPAVVSVTRDVASEVNTSDIVNMYSRMLPQSLGRAVWVVNQTVLPSLLTLTIDVGTGGSAVGIVNIAGSPFMTILGRPILITEKVPALGTASDINFIDFGYYLLGDRQAVSIESSSHNRFLEDETSLKVIERVDGRPWMQSAITPKNGSTLSPYVRLAT